MKKFLIAILFGIASLTAFAEASFDEIQGLINSKQYAAAAAGLENIIQNHPKSAKAFYAMAEAQAGLGNLDKAQKALNIAKGFDPTLKFVSEGSVRSLEQAITPQTQKITYEEPSHFWRNLFLLLFVGAIGFIIYYFFVKKNREADDNYKTGTSGGPTPMPPDSPIKPTARKTASSYVPPPETPVYREPVSSRTVQPTYSSTPAPQATTTVVNNSSNDMLTGVLIGNMLSGNHHHDTTRVVEREVVREVPSRSSSWDDTPSKPSRSSSWDDDAPSKKSSSWDSDSSSSRSSSWESSSSSSSSWDSGSSSSDSGSSSSWD